MQATRILQALYDGFGPEPSYRPELAQSRRAQLRAVGLADGSVGLARSLEGIDLAAKLSEDLLLVLASL